MWKYIRLNLFVISKRVSTWLIPIFFIITLFCVTGLPVMMHYGPQTKTLITTTDKRFLVIPFIMIIAFVATKVLNIFKDPEDDGTELMVASKPITRAKIIFGKFLTLYILIALFSFATFIFSLMIAQVDKMASTTEVLTFSLSMGFGTWIMSMLLSAIVIFFSSVFGKIGAIVCSIMVPLIFATTSTTLLMVTKLSLSNPYGNSSKFVQSTYAIQDNKIITKQGTPQFIPDPEGTPSVSNNDYESTNQQIYTKHANHWYQYAAYADAWTQLTTFYYMFNKNEANTNNPNWKYRVSKEVPASSLVDPAFLVKVKRHAYYSDNNTYQKHIFVDKDNNNQIIEATIPYMLKTERRNRGGNSNKTKELKQEALTNSKKVYDNFNAATKIKLKDLFEDWASKYTNTPSMFSALQKHWSDITDELEGDIFKTVPSFFKGEWLNYLSNNHGNSKDNDVNGEMIKNTLMSYLVLKMLKENTSAELNSETKSVLFSDQTFTEYLTPVGIDLNDKRYGEKEESKSSSSSSVHPYNGYDQIIFGSKTPFKEPTVKKLVPSKYVPDLLVYLAWPAITILLSALIILKYMRRDFK